MSKYLISVILAVREWSEADIQRLVSSLSMQTQSAIIQLVVIFSNNSPESAIKNHAKDIGNVKCIYDHPNGVYNAYETGVTNADGDYIILSGGDDFFMPGLSIALSDILLAVTPRPDLIAANVCFGDSRLLKPSKTKFGLVMRNWCQQGVIYRRSIFDEFHFDESYKIQADHKFNIEIIGSGIFIIHYTELIVAYFSCGGVSQSQPDLNFWRDMPSIVSKNFGWHYGFICYLRKAAGYIYYGPPEKRFKVIK